MPTRPVFWLAGILALGILLRALYLLTPALDSDQAIVGLMGRHILHGEFPIFFWGQPFAGTIEAHLAAVLFFLFGPSRLTLALSPFLFSLAFLLLTYRLAREAFDRETGLLALLLAAIPAPFLTSHSVTARSNYIENLVLGSLVLLLALRIPREPGPGRERSLILLGLFAGLAWYQSPQSAHYLLTSGVFLVLRDPRLFLQRAFWMLPPAFLLGSLPFWVYNLRAPSMSTIQAIYSQAGGVELADSLFRYAREKIPYVLGVAPRGEGLESSLPLLVLGLYGLAFLRLVHRWRVRGNQLILVFLLITSIIIVLGYNRGASTRYLLPLYSALPIMMAAFLAALRRVSVPVFIMALAGLLFTNLAATTATAEILDASKLELYRGRRARDTQLFSFLRAEGLTRVYVFDFWEAYRLTFDAQESIVFAEPGPSFYPPYTHMVDAAERYAYVIRRKDAVQGFEENLRSVGGAYRKREMAGYAVFDAFTPPAGPPLRAVPRAAWTATASHAAAETGRAFDRDLFTSWGPDSPQRPGAHFLIDLGRVRTIGQVTLLAGFPDDRRTFRIESSIDGEGWQTALALVSSWRGLSWAGPRLRVDASGRIQGRFLPTPARWIRLTLLGGDEAFEWSIRELFISEISAEHAPAVPSLGADALRRGIERMREGKWSEAVRAFQEAVDRDPEWEEAHVQLLVAAQQLGIDRQDSYERALILEQRGLAELATRELWKAIQGFPHSSHTDPLLRFLRLGGAGGDPARVERARQFLAALVPAERIEASFEDQIRFLGYAIDRREVEPGGRIRLSYFWECLKPMEKDYVIFVHLSWEGGALSGDDHSPLQGLYPTSRWRKGEVVREDRAMRIPPTTKPGPLTLSVGVWDPSTGTRLRVEGMALAPRADRVQVTQLVVTSQQP